ncbi:MAG: helicase HerA-like C-terminal domain-containing protein [Pseudomonadota bacterium]
MSEKENAIYVGSETDNPDNKLYFDLKWGNRHGLIAGATGTGKTVTLQNLAEGFSDNGVPVFMADVKGDLSGLCQPSEMEDFLVKRANIIGLEDYKARTYPVTFWDVFAEQGHPIRTTISEIGPILLARMLELNDTQEGVLNIAFRLADEEGMLLLDLKDLRALLISMADRASEISNTYGMVSKQSIAAIQRSLLRLEDQGGAQFFGEPALELKDFMRNDMDGKGMVNILAADKLMQSPRLYATFLLWMLSELFEELPEAGDAEKPKLVFFFDEAHLLFDDAPKALIEKVEQVVRLIRSKGVGIFFITQNPADIPDTVLGQLGNRVQHALRAFTPKQQKAIKAASETYRENPKFDVADVITDLGVGEALVSTLEGKGNPSMVERTLVRPPMSRLGPASADAKRMAMQADGVGAKYDTTQDRESAYEVLQKRAEEASKKAAEAQEQAEKAKTKKRSSNRQSVGEAAVKSIVRSMSSSLGRTIAREIIRGVLGGLKR